MKRLEEGARFIRQHLARSRVALLFGSEKRGLSKEDLSHCHCLVSVPTQKDHRSMNLGQAVAVCLYELARDPRAIPQPEKRIAATAREIERITLLLLDALRESGYLKTNFSDSQNCRSAASTEGKIRRLIRGLNLSPTQVQLGLGMLRKILWKLRCGNAASR